MTLSKADINDVLIGNPYEMDIRHSLSNYFEDLEKPVAVAIGLAPFKKSDLETEEDAKENKFSMRGAFPKQVDQLVNLFRKNGIDAVSFLDPAAKNPEKFVVTPSGIMCPFMLPEDTLKATVQIETLARSENYNLVGHVNPQSAQNILYTADKKLERKANESHGSIDNYIDIKESNPQKDKFAELEQKYGGDYKSFINNKINEAYRGAETVDFAKIDEENVYKNGGESLFRGGCLGANPYAVISEYNSRKVAHSSPAASICSGFSGKGHSFSTRGGAVYEATQSGLEYGFIYRLHSMGDEQKYYQNVGLETAYDPHALQEGLETGGADTPWNGFTGGLYETPILPHHNKVEAIYVHVGLPGENKLFAIPLDENGNIKDPEWRDFMAMHEPSDDKVVGYLAERQNAQKREQTENPDHSYKFELKKDLPEDTQEYLKSMTATEFLGSLIHKSQIKELTNNQFEIDDSNGALSVLEGLKISYLPDMSNLKINGNLLLTTVPEIKAANLPETTHGFKAFNCKITGIEQITADRLTKILGMEQKNGWYIDPLSSLNTLNMDGIPQGWENAKFDQLPMGVNLVYETFEQIPETRKGIGYSGVIIKNQSSIENMPVESFLYKVKGNVGTRLSPPALESEEFTPVEKDSKIEIHLENSNISNFPKGFNEYSVGRIILNSETKVTSLENFPVTKNGCLNLNFDGDLKNETMESFLNKIKGTEWVKNNTTKAPDGHLIITGDLNFKAERYSDRDKPQIKITSLPKDFSQVEIKGRIAPSEIGQFAFIHGQITKMLGSDNLSVPLSHQKDISLENLSCSKLELEGSGKITEKLPQKLNKLSISDNEQAELSVPLPESCEYLSFFNSSVNGSFNVPEQVKDFYASNATFEYIPQFSGEKENLTLRNSEFKNGQAFNLPAVKSVCLDNVHLPDGAILDLSQCKEVRLDNIDVSKCTVIMPEKADYIYIANTKFPEGYRLDLSNCESGNINRDVQSTEIILPKQFRGENISLPDSVKEVSTTFLASALKIECLPDNIKITDKPKDDGKLVSLGMLKRRGVSDKQLKMLRKERIKNKLLSPFKKLSEIFHKKDETKADAPAADAPKIGGIKAGKFISSMRNGINPLSVNNSSKNLNVARTTNTNTNGNIPTLNILNNRSDR